MGTDCVLEAPDVHPIGPQFRDPGSGYRYHGVVVLDGICDVGRGGA
jgi:hypothetical protein